MDDFHQKSDLISPEEIQRIEKVLEAIWSRETADPDVRDQWSEENKALGQCAITSVLIYDLFGGRIIYDKANFHVWNELPDGSQQDFTRSQFKEERTFSLYKYKTKEDILYIDERGKRTKIEERYKKLKEAFSSKFVFLYSKSNI
jgi:hypothetical protein